MKKLKTSVDFFTEGLLQGESFATKAGREYIVRLCQRIINMGDDIESIQQLCKNTIKENTGLETYERQR